MEKTQQITDEANRKHNSKGVDFKFALINNYIE